MSFKIRDLTADVLPMRFSEGTCPNSGVGDGKDDEPCGRGSGHPCAQSSRRDDGKLTHNALPALRLQLREALGAQV